MMCAPMRRCQPNESNFKVIDDKGTIMFLDPMEDKVEDEAFIEHHLFQEWCEYWRRAEEVKSREVREQIKGLLVELLVDLYRIEKKAETK